MRDRRRGRPPEPASPLGHAPAPRFAAGPGGGSGNKTGTNRRRAKRIRFSRKKRVDSRRAPTTNAVGYRFAAPPFGGARRNGAHRTKGGTKRARIVRLPIRAGKRAPASLFPRSTSPAEVYGFPTVNAGSRRRSRRGIARSKRGQRRRESATARIAGPKGARRRAPREAFKPRSRVRAPSPAAPTRSPPKPSPRARKSP